MKALDILKIEKLPVYIVGGDDDYLVQYAKKSIYGLVDGVARDFNITEYTVPRTIYQDTLQRIDDALQALPIMSSMRVVTADIGVGKLSKDLEKALSELIKRHSESGNNTSVLMIINRDNIIGGMAKYAEVIDCNRMSEGELLPIVDKIIRDAGFSSTPNVVRMLVERCDRYLSRIVKELDKLKVFAKDNTIDIDAINECLPEKSEYIVYEITDALSKGDRFAAVRAIDRIVNAFSNESDGAMKILNTLIGHYRKMFFGRISPLTDADLSKQFGCKPFAITMARRSASNYKPMELKKILDRLVSVESGVKSGNITVKEIIPLVTCAVL